MQEAILVKPTPETKPKDQHQPAKRRWPSPAAKKRLAYAIFVLAWTGFSIVFSQYAIIYPMSWILGAKLNQPFWTLVFYLLYNGLALTLILVVPPQIFKYYQRRGRKLNSDSDQFLHTNPDELGVANWPTFVDLGLAPIAYFVYAVVAGTIVNLLSLLPWFNANEAQNVGFGPVLAGNDRIIAVIALVFVAPIFEEIIMRGWLYGKLRNKFKIPLAIFLTSALFGLLHGQANVGVTVFVLSVVLCGLREITGTIWCGILLHMLTNGIAFYFLYVGFGL